MWPLPWRLGSSPALLTSKVREKSQSRRILHWHTKHPAPNESGHNHNYFTLDFRLINKKGHAMRAEWFGDRRDLVKWSILANIVQKNSVKRVIYVPFFPNENTPNEVHPTVWQHFRDLVTISPLAQKLGFEVSSINKPFDNLQRGDYIAMVLSAIQCVDHQPRLVCLDPDTGLEPQKLTLRHVSIAELIQIWAGLDRSGDRLVVYQHRWRDPQWKELALKRFSEALIRAHCHPVSIPNIDPDVLMLVAERL